MKLSVVCLSMFLMLNLFNAARADEHSGVTLVSTELLSGLLEKTDGGVEGIYPEFFAQAAQKADVTLNYRIVPWSRAVYKTERSEHYLLFPLTRTRDREERFNWLAKLWEIPICFLAMSKPINSFQEAKRLEGIMVWRGSSHKQKLMELGFTNLIPFDNPRLVKGVLAKRANVAWYTPCNEGEALGRSFNLEREIIIGEAVDYETVWLAGGTDYQASEEKQRFLNAVTELAAEDALKQKILIGTKALE